MVIEPSGCKKQMLAYFSFTLLHYTKNMATSVSYAERTLIFEWMITCFRTKLLQCATWTNGVYFFFFSPNTLSWLVHSAKNWRMADLASFHSLQPFTILLGLDGRLGRGCFDPYVTSFIIDQIIFQKDQTNHPKWVKIHKTMIMVFSFTIQKW